MNEDKPYFLKQISEPIAYYKSNKKGGKQKYYLAEFLCDCGNRKILDPDKVKNGPIKSCGCYNRQLASERASKLKKKYRDGITSHSLYARWKRFKFYFPVCHEWLEYEPFYNWAIDKYDDKLVISRIDDSLPYSPTNCVFNNRSDVVRPNPEKQKQTCIDRYGVDSAMKLEKTKNKAKETNLKKYGVTSPLMSDIIKEKIKQTNLDKYGHEYACQSDDVKKKIEQTCIKKYGFKSPSENPDIKKKQIETNIARYGTPYYNSSSLHEQKEILEFVNSFGYVFISDHNVLDGKEIDMYNDELKFGIEYCGLYWHSEEYVNKNQHYNKYKKCKDSNVRLITLFADEWKNRNNQVKNFISSILSKNQQKLYARKCDVKEIEGTIAKNFIEQNHIQGCKKSPLVAFGLYNKETLVGVMSFNKHHRQGNEAKLVLDRMVFADNITIIGGASRLLSLGKEYAKNNGYKSIISWSDNRFSAGNVYKTIGFTLEKEYGPDYFYIKLSSTQKRISKQSMTKKKLGCPKEKTESSYARELGYSRVWDCGKKLWTIDITNTS